jgi:hypothetical protein
MSNEGLQQTWIRRCAQRIRLRHVIADDEAMELAREMHHALGGAGCPERVAEELFADSVMTDA